MLTNIIAVIHLLICVFMILVILLQQGKGADMGATFGGGGNTLFGASGADNILVRVTTIGAMLFMCTSVYLAVSGKAPTKFQSKLFPTTQAPNVTVVPNGAVTTENPNEIPVENGTAAPGNPAAAPDAAAPVTGAPVSGAPVSAAPAGQSNPPITAPDAAAPAQSAAPAVAPVGPATANPPTPAPAGAVEVK